MMFVVNQDGVICGETGGKKDEQAAGTVEEFESDST
jgi:hypothetical protein